MTTYKKTYLSEEVQCDESDSTDVDEKDASPDDQNDESSDNDVDSVDSNDSSDDDKSGNEGWADSMAKILKAKAPKGKKTLVLSKAKKISDLKKGKPVEAGFEVISDIKEEKPSIDKLPKILQDDDEPMNKRDWMAGISPFSGSVAFEHKSIIHFMKVVILGLEDVDTTIEEGNIDHWMTGMANVTI